MSGENIEATGREVMEALGRQDLPRLIELSDPEVEWHSLFAAVPLGCSAVAFTREQKRSGSAGVATHAA
jgi:hypothetical protein